MQHTFIPYSQVSQLSNRDRAYITRDAALTPFIVDWPSIEAFQSVIDSKKKQDIPRSALHKTIKSQYAKLKSNDKIDQNIDAILANNTFFIITAHQPSLLTGPLYYIYKICSTIHLAQKLSAQYADYQILPVFISGSEDHDFEEVNHLRLFGKTYTWETAQSGPVGRFHLDGLEPLLEEVFATLGASENATELKEIIKRASKNAKTYNDFVRSLVHDLFGDFGLLMLNMDDKTLKEAAKPIFKEEMLHQSSYKTILPTLQKLKQVGHKPQAEPREINLFYIEDGIRERFVLEDNIYKVNGTEISFTENEISKFIDEHPEKISPNVVMRPIYQELVLPNLAYIGGGGELAYWQERKAQFEHFQVPMPLLIRRNSAVILDNGGMKQKNKLDLSFEDLFQKEHLLSKIFLEKNSTNELDLQQEKSDIEVVFNQIAQKAKSIADPLEKLVLAEKTKQIKALENIEAKLVKEEKRKYEVSLNKISKLKLKLFPGDGLQERHDNFMGMYLQHGKAGLQYLVDHLDPLRSEFTVFYPD